MEQHLIDSFIEILPTLIKENDQIKGAILSALTGVVATRQDIKDLIEEMDKRFEEQYKASDKRIKEQNDRWDKRFEEQNNASDKRFDAIDKRFEEQNKRFEERFDKMDIEIKSTNKKLDSLLNIFGKPFEQFGRNVISRLLKGEGYPNVKIEPMHLKDDQNIVHEATTDIEIDGISHDPAIIVEITSILRKNEKLDKFLKKKKFVEDYYKKPFRGFFVASGTEINQEEKADLLVRLRENNCELINL